MKVCQVRSNVEFLLKDTVKDYFDEMEGEKEVPNELMDKLEDLIGKFNDELGLILYYNCAD